MIRLKVAIPFVLIVGLIVWIVVYRIDALVSGWIEDGVSLITGTKTDIHELKISFKNSSLVIRRMEIGSQEDEWKNAIEFEDIIIDFQSLPLLKKRVVIDNFSIKGLQWGTQRKTSAKLPPKKKDSEPSWLSETMNEAWGSLKGEMAKTPVGKLTDFSIPNDTREILDTLKLESEGAFKSATETSQNLRAEWLDQIKELRNISEYERRIQEGRNLVKNPPKDPQGIAKAIEFLGQTKDFFQSEKQRAENLFSKVGGDYQRIKDEYQKADSALRNDIDRAKKMISLDELNIANISKLMFGDLWISRAETVLKYHALLRRLMTSSSKDESVEVKKRAKGRDIIFVTPKREPSFVLAKSDFSVKGLENGDRKMVGQLYELSLRDLNSAPKLYGKPTSIGIKAELKNAPIESAQFKSLLDYTKEPSKDDFSLSVEGIDADGWQLGIPKLFPVRINKAKAKTNAELHFIGDDFVWKTKLSLDGMVWDFSEVPNKGSLVPILETVFRDIKTSSIELTLAYKESKFDFSVSSDMDSQIKKGVEAVLQKKLAELQARLEQEVQTRMAVYRQKALDEVKKFESEISDRVKETSSKIQSFSNEANSFQDQMKKESQKAVESKVQDGLKDIKKNFPSIPNPFK